MSSQPPTTGFRPLGAVERGDDLRDRDHPMPCCVVAAHEELGDHLAHRRAALPG